MNITPSAEMVFTSRNPLRLGTRQSPLAMKQAEMAAAALCAAHNLSPDAIRLVPMIASGDKVLDKPLVDMGGKALWTKELDRALAAGEIDAAVHSMKDVETVRPDIFVIGAMLERADIRDRLICAAAIGADSVAALPQGARIGTASPRRAAQLRALRPDLVIGLIRGNVATRLSRLEQGEFDATLLAAAGLDRLGMHDTGHAIAVAEMLPAPSQGAIGIETLADNAPVRALLAAIDHRPTHICVMAERALLLALGADCRSPVAASAVMAGDEVHLTAEILTEDGSERVRGETRFAAGDKDAPAALARDLLNRASPALRGLFEG